MKTFAQQPFELFVPEPQGLAIGKSNCQIEKGPTKPESCQDLECQIFFATPINFPFFPFLSKTFCVSLTFPLLFKCPLVSFHESKPHFSFDLWIDSFVFVFLVHQKTSRGKKKNSGGKFKTLRMEKCVLFKLKTSEVCENRRTNLLVFGFQHQTGDCLAFHGGSSRKRRQREDAMITQRKQKWLWERTTKKVKVCP